jgi:hypothetical protein
MSGMKIKYYFEIRNTKTGKLVSRSRKRTCRSFTIGFLKILEYLMSHSYGGVGSSVTIVDTGGSNRIVTADNGSSQLAYRVFACECPGNVTTYGLQVGTGTTAVTTSDHVIETLIAHGSGAGQLNYGSTTVGGAVDAGSGCTLTISRQFGNASGNTITIKELTLVCENYNSYFFLLARDNVDQAVANGNTATAIIEITTEL